MHPNGTQIKGHGANKFAESQTQNGMSGKAYRFM